MYSRPGPRGAARQAAAKPGAHTFRDFRIMNGAPRRYLPALMARGLWAKLRG